MGSGKKLRYFLVHELKISYDKAIDLIRSGAISVDGKKILSDMDLDRHSEVRVNDTVIRSGRRLICFLFHKPRGIECTTNPEIEDNLLSFFPEGLQLHAAGRLDKQSEGLLLLTNNGDLTKHILQTGVEKEYEVEVDKAVDEEFRIRMESGVKIMGRITKPCVVRITGERSFTIVLTQGLNRQIRRMCYKLGYEVMKLKRVRIGEFLLADLKEGELREADFHARTSEHNLP